MNNDNDNLWMVRREEKDGVEYVLWMGREEEDHRGWFTSKRDADWVSEQLAESNEWAWCIVRVTAARGGFEGQDILGACSYKSQADFLAANWEDMKAEALADLRQTLANAMAEGYAAERLLREIGRGN